MSCLRRDLNPQCPAYYADALPTEPSRQLSWAVRIFKVYAMLDIDLMYSVHVHVYSRVQCVLCGVPLISPHIVAQYMHMHVCTSCEVLHRLGGAGSGSPQCAVIGCQHSHALSKCVPHSLLSFVQ